MRPALSVVFLTTLIGAGQGLFAAAFAGELLGDREERRFLAAAALGAVGLASLGLLASFFHLGRPERAWRSASMWRTSWLSREVIALPLFIGLAAAWGMAHYREWPGTALLGVLALAACAALFVCTAMIYACVRFLQEWASPYTAPNFVLMGCASGTTLAAALSAALAPRMAPTYAIAAIVLATAALATRTASLLRNARLTPRSTLQSAIGVMDPVVRQVSQGFTAGAFNTQEFFHGRSFAAMQALRFTFPLLAFVVPTVMLGAGIAKGSTGLLAAAFAVQFAGLLMERWYFLADARHPQNLYYQRVA
jgi:DMSO reductase anchor subunit